MPLLAGSNADEVRAGVVLGKERPTGTSFAEQTRSRFGAAADTLLRVYPAGDGLRARYEALGAALAAPR